MKKVNSLPQSDWLEKAKWQQENDFWISKSQRIALKMLMKLKKLKVCNHKQ